MYLQKIRLINFKNYEDQSVACSKEVNCLIGKNGSGKTNFLDAVYYLSFAKSAFNSLDNQNIRHGQEFMSLLGQVQTDDKSVDLQCSIPVGQKKLVKWNKQQYEKLSEHIGRMPVVMISPYDADLIRDGSELRRKFFDMIISMLDKAYLENLIRYNRFLKQRNSLLKEGAVKQSWDQALIDTYDQEMIRLSKAIASTRSEHANTVANYFQEHYEQISGNREQTSITYESEAINSNFAERYKAQLDRDKILQRTTMGIHRDDYIFSLDGRSIKKFGSQGQQKSFAISLKLAQFQLLEDKLGMQPVLLLDDVFDKLDDQRIEILIELITSKKFGQIFLTDARPERTKEILSSYKGAVQFFNVEDGRITPLSLSS
ncbi:MAG: DNA replication/repair protein RecF [Bacteroidota bacterium]